MSRFARPRVILITGATSAIGSALAVHYAGSGVTLLLHGRDGERLGEVAGRCRGLGAVVEVGCFDVRDREGLAGWLGDVCGRWEVDLVVVNAGMNIDVGDDFAGEDWGGVEALLEVNIRAALATVHGVLPSMRLRGHGQVALMSSLAGYFGLPVTPSYCASKAALKAYGEGLRGLVGVEGIGVSVVMPGYVESAMCRAMPGPKPFLWGPERAARVIAAGLAVDRARIAFPFPLSWGTWFLGVLPPGVAAWFVEMSGYGRKKGGGREG